MRPTACWPNYHRRGGMTGVYACHAVGFVFRSSRPCLNRKRDLRVTHGRDGAEKMPSVHPAPIRAIPPLRHGWVYQMGRGGMTGVYACHAVGFVFRSSRPCLNRKRDLRVTHGRDGAEKMPSVHPAPIRAIPPLPHGWVYQMGRGDATGIDAGNAVCLPARLRRPFAGVAGADKGEPARGAGFPFTMRLSALIRPYRMFGLPQMGWMGQAWARRRGEDAVCSPCANPRHPDPTPCFWVFMCCGEEENRHADDAD